MPFLFCVVRYLDNTHVLMFCSIALLLPWEICTLSVFNINLVDFIWRGFGSKIDYLFITLLHVIKLYLRREQNRLGFFYNVLVYKTSIYYVEKLQI